MPSDSVTLEPWEQLDELIERGDYAVVADFLHELPPEDTAYTISHLEDDKQRDLFAALADVDADLAADLMEHFVDEQAADLLEDLEPEKAAAIVDEMDSDEQTDVLSEVDEEEQEAILAAMTPEEAVDARKRLAYGEESAGGLMVTEYLAYPDSCTVDDIVNDLRHKAEEYQDADYETRYVYLTDDQQRMKGIVRLRWLLLSPHNAPSTQALRTDDVLTVNVNATLDELQSIFERRDYTALPVVDDHERLVGVVRRAAVEEAATERSEQQFLRFGGIIGGEELRTMPLLERCARRLAFLGPNILLFMLSISVIATFEPVIAQVTALAVFLPLVAGMSGASANQSVAVSIREMAMPDVGRVVVKEAMLGAFNGVVIGILLALVAFLFSGKPLLGGIIGFAFACNSIIAVSLGGSMPLILKRIGVDPAMASSPIVATLTDMTGFFITLMLSYILIQYLITP